jgi:hypothetical protein
LEHGCGLRLYRRRFLAGDPLALIFGLVFLIVKSYDVLDNLGEYVFISLYILITIISEHDH